MYDEESLKKDPNHQAVAGQCAGSPDPLGRRVAVEKVLMESNKGREGDWGRSSSKFGDSTDLAKLLGKRKENS